MKIESVTEDGREPCRHFELYRADPAQSAPTVIWSHLTICSPCMAEFQQTEGFARDYLFEFEYSSEISIFRDVFGDWKERNAQAAAGWKLGRPFEDQVPRIPGFEVERRVGRGGSSEVWLARQEGLNRLVALKIMHKTTNEQRERLQKECRILASLSHPHLLPIYANGLLEDKVWMALEYCPGGSLNFRLTQPWGAKESADLVKKVALAAHAVHEKGIIHRDIKPGNILLGADEEPKLADFDLARSLEIGQESTRQTQILGTPAYIAPEQVRSKKVDARADIHALGAVLYHLLTGRPPFKADNTYEALLMAVHTDPVPPIHLRPGLPKDIDQICRRCLAKDPADRYATAGELAADLERFQQDKPVKARPLSRPQTAWRWAKRNRGLAIMGSAAAFALICVALVSTVAAYQAIHFANVLKKSNGEMQAAKEKALAEAKRAEESDALTQGELYVNRINRAQMLWESGDVKAAQDQLDQCPFGLRGWEYRYLNTLFHSQYLTLAKNESIVTAVSFSPNEKLIASCGNDKQVHLWDFEKASHLMTLSGHSSSVTCLAFSKDGDQLASGCLGGLILIWDTRTGERIRRLERKDSLVSSLAFSGDGTKIASCYQNGEICLWDCNQGSLLRAKKGSSENLNALVSTPDGKSFACGGRDRAIRYYDFQHFGELLSIEGNYPINGLAFSPDGKRIAVANNDERESLTVYDAKTGQRLIGTKCHKEYTNSIAFGKDGRTLVTGGSDNKVVVCDSITGSVLGALKGHTGVVGSIAMHSQCNLFVTGSLDGTVKIWNLNQHQFSTFSNRESGNRMNCMIHDPGRGRLIVGTDHGEIRFFDQVNLKLINVIKAHEKAISCMDISPDGSLLATGSGDGTSAIWDLERNSLRHRHQNDPAYARQVLFIAGGSRVLTAAYGREIKVMDCLSGKELERIQSQDIDLQHFCLSYLARRKIIVTSSNKNELIFLNAINYQVEKRLLFPNEITLIKISESEEGIIAACDKTLYFVDINNDFKILPFHTNGTTVASVAFGNADRIIFVSDQDKTLKIFNAINKKHLLNIYDHTGIATGIIFTENSGCLYTCCWDNTVRKFSANIYNPNYNITNKLSDIGIASIEKFQKSSDLPFSIFSESQELVLAEAQDEYRLLDYSQGTVRVLTKTDDNNRAKNSRPGKADGPLVFRSGSEGARIVNTLHEQENHQKKLMWLKEARYPGEYIDWVLLRHRADRYPDANTYHSYNIVLNLRPRFSYIYSRCIQFLGESGTLDATRTGMMSPMAATSVRFHGAGPLLTKSFALCRFLALCLARQARGEWERPGSPQDALIASDHLPNQRPASGSIYSVGSAQQYPNGYAFAALTREGKITAWGDSAKGGRGWWRPGKITAAAPIDDAFIEIFSNQEAFAALRKDGSIASWGNPVTGGANAPGGSGYVHIFSTQTAFAALKGDGSISVWGDPKAGGTGAPTDSGFVQIFASRNAFVALKQDGRIVAWGNPELGGRGAPTDSGYRKVFSAGNAFAALKSDGRIATWGPESMGGKGGPTDSGYTQIQSTYGAFAALKNDGTIFCWGSHGHCDFGAPTGSDFIDIQSGGLAFSALKRDGSIVAWGSPGYGGVGAPTGKGFIRMFSTLHAFAAIKADGSIQAWGHKINGGSGAPGDSGYTQVFSNVVAFAALKRDGSISTWGDPEKGGIGAPTDSGYKRIFISGNAFAAMKDDGTLRAWGDPQMGGDCSAAANALESGAIAFASPFTQRPWITSSGRVPFMVGLAGRFQVECRGLTRDAVLVVEDGVLPKGLKFDPVKRVLYGTPEPGTAGNYKISMAAANGSEDLAAGVKSRQTFTLMVQEPPCSFALDRAIFAEGVEGSYELQRPLGLNPIYYLESALPRGLSLSNEGQLSGKAAPGTAGTHHAVVLTYYGGTSFAATPLIVEIQPQSPAVGQSWQANSAIAEPGHQFGAIPNRGASHPLPTAKSPNLPGRK